MSKPYFAKLLPVEIGHKLFLCSRDIQLNDRYYHDEYCPYPIGELADTNTKVMDAHMMVTNEGDGNDGDHSFKVIGEISPDAGWVKEGNGFIESEVRGLSKDHTVIYEPDFDCKQEWLLYIEVLGLCHHFH